MKKEMPVPDPTSRANRWSIDFFFVDQHGLPTFVECKRYNDTRARREVIGQMFEYAANAHYYWTTEDSVRFADQTAQRRKESLDDLLSSLQEQNQESLETFFEKVENNLTEARVRLIFFLEEAFSELRSMVDHKQMKRTEVSK